MMHTGAFVYGGKKVTLAVDNVIPVGQCPEGSARATIGIIAGGGRIDKPLIKARPCVLQVQGKTLRLAPYSWCGYEPRRPPSRRKKPPAHRKASIIARSAVPGQKIGLIAARRTGPLRGTVKVKEV
ncbi:60S ribosomal protein L2/L8 [Mycena sanguinolenta]|uniref:60S ribosomal protein L2/L8 n=1 Tax=Mycena sanguinolenta TaxID=230812 RepID=A0A8H6YAR2_9AGAR|nr:60S ribosomal protein L2/L8 [Mycena sanguinolenta]